VAPVAKSAVSVTVEALSDGVMRYTSEFLFTLEMTPDMPNVKDAMVAAAGAYEGRPQNITISPMESYRSF
jgi:hypothetical protein